MSSRAAKNTATINFLKVRTKPTMHQQDKLLVGKHVKQKAYIQSGKTITYNSSQNAI
jgi:hypothetical protein